jgi:hypothetical protein
MVNSGWGGGVDKYHLLKTNIAHIIGSLLTEGKNL